MKTAKTEILKISKSGVDFIKKFEGIHDGDLSKIGLQPKMCPAGIWTVGYGYALVNKDNGKWIKGRDQYHLIQKQYPELLTITEEDAVKLLDQILDKYELKVLRNIKVDISQTQFDMLVSHTFNTGGSDTLFKLINSEAKMIDIEKWWTTKYITADGVRLPGLIRRRREEFQNYSK